MFCKYCGYDMDKAGFEIFSIVPFGKTKILCNKCKRMITTDEMVSSHKQMEIDKEKKNNEMNKQKFTEQLIIAAINGLCAKYGIVGDDASDFYSPEEIAEYAIKLSEIVKDKLHNN